MTKLEFASDYMEGAHPEIIRRLTETNMKKTAGYGSDPYSLRAKQLIREACDCPKAEIQFLVGGTQANMVVIDSLLNVYQGVIAADSGHVSVHEAGAIEYTGHKVLTIPSSQGKINAEQIDQYCHTFYSDGNYEHMVMPGMVYLSQPSEYGTLYSLKELEEIRQICSKYDLKLYIDGARLAYALACDENDVSLKDLARLCDVFYLGGTKCGMLFGEAVVIPNPDTIPHFFTIIKTHGALVAKGRITGLQYLTMFEDDLYEKAGKNAIEAAECMKQIFAKHGYPFAYESPTNQIFILFEDEKLKKLEEFVSYSFWEKYDADHTIVRFATSWATNLDDVRKLDEILTEFKVG